MSVCGFPDYIKHAFRFTVDPTPGWFQTEMDKGKIRVHNFGVDFIIARFKVGDHHFMQADIGDWIVLDVDGQVFPYKNINYYWPNTINCVAINNNGPAPEPPVKDLTVREEIWSAIEAERGRQDQKWGPNFDDRNTPNDWATYITHQLYKATHFNFDPALFEQQMIRVAAVAIAAIETLHRNKGMAPRHYDPPKRSERNV